MKDCLFCKMAGGEITPDMVHEDDELMVFRDVNPQAPVHCLIVPRRHIATLDDLEEGDAGLVGRLYLTAKRTAALLGLEAGYRTVMNCNRDGGQTVFHIHLHLLGGRRMHWPPG